jgi:hypothetical protein
MSANAEAITVMHRALDLLGRASADWRNGGQCDGTALHWPVAVDLARRELQQALGTMEGQPDERTGDARAGIAWFNQLTPTQRSHWLTCARLAVPADAWEAFKSEDAQP